MSHSTNSFSSVYGPVQSWRWGRSLGVDPIGAVSTCSFRCVYCQLGEIECQTVTRQVFISTPQVAHDLGAYAPWDVDVVTVSGSGEPTLARNLGELLTLAKTMTARPVAVLTNGSLLNDPTVRVELAIADRVAVKLDAIDNDSLRRVNRTLPECQIDRLWSGLQQFRQQYAGMLSVQTMLLLPWSEQQQVDYIELMHRLQPDEIQLNTPTRPKPVRHQIDARENHAGDRPYLVKRLKPVSAATLQQFGDRIQTAIGISTRYPELCRAAL